MRFGRRCAFMALLSVGIVGCDKDGPSLPTNPSPPPATTTRVIGVTGNLSFGDVMVGERREASMVVTNSGNATLTVTAMNVTGGLEQHTTANWTSGQIAAGGSQSVMISFQPVAPGTYTGTLTVVGDMTSGTNTIAVSGNGLPASSYAGLWSGNYIVEQCNGTGSLQDLLCSSARGVFPVGSSLPIAMDLTQSGNAVSGTFALGQVRGVANGIVNSAGFLVLQGTATNGQLTAQITSWSTRAQGNVMEGTFTYNATISGTPGVAVVVTRLGSVTK